MATTARVGTGLTITRAGWSFEILDFSGPNASIATIDASKMSSTGWKEYICGSLKDAGECTVQVEWQGVMPTIGVYAATTITHNGGAIISGSMAITNVGPRVPLEDKMVADITLKVSGALT
jgi:hypothetical protein